MFSYHQVRGWSRSHYKREHINRRAITTVFCWIYIFIIDCQFKLLYNILINRSPLTLRSEPWNVGIWKVIILFPWSRLAVPCDASTNQWRLIQVWVLAYRHGMFTPAAFPFNPMFPIPKSGCSWTTLALSAHGHQQRGATMTGAEQRRRRRRRQRQQHASSCISLA